MATCSDCGIDVTQYVLELIRDKLLVLPDEIYLSKISIYTGYTSQLIGASFHDYVEKKLKASGISARKAGLPVRLQLKWIEGLEK